MLEVFARIGRVAPHYRIALITGATGTGQVTGGTNPPQPEPGRLQTPGGLQLLRRRRNSL
jgi:hypothetical protein